MFGLSLTYSARQSSNHKIIQKPQNPSCTQIYIKHNRNIEHKIFEELVPSVLPLLKKHIGEDTLVSWTIPSIYQYQIFEKKKYKKKKRLKKKEWTEAIN